MSRRSILYILLTLFIAVNLSDNAGATRHVLQKHNKEVQDRHNKLIVERMAHIKKTMKLTGEEERLLNTALITLDKKRFVIWKQSVDLRKSLERQENTSEEAAEENLQKLLELDREMDRAHGVFFREIEQLGFSSLQRLQLYLSLKSFHSRMGKSMRD